MRGKPTGKLKVRDPNLKKRDCSMKSLRHSMVKFKNASSRPTLVLVSVVILGIIGLMIDASRAPKPNSQRPPVTSTPVALMSQAHPLEEAEARQERSFKIKRRYEYLESLAMDLRFKGSGEIVSTGGKELSALTLKFPTINQRFVDKMSTENHFLAKLGGLGFKTVTFTNGRDANWTFDFTTYHWRH
jgi:hypothetical protein